MSCLHDRVGEVSCAHHDGIDLACLMPTQHLTDGANDDASVSDISGGSAESDSSSSSTPTPPRCSSPRSQDAARKLSYPDLPRSSSMPRTGPGLGSRTNMAVSVGRPYLHPPLQNSMFPESPVLAAIHGYDCLWSCHVESAGYSRSVRATLKRIALSAADELPIRVPPWPARHR